MEIKYIKKNITTLVSPAIIMHGVNCANAMASGVAKALYTKFPEVKEQYHKYGTMQLGDIQPVQVRQELWVVNCFTQDKYGYGGGKYAYPSSIQRCAANVARFAQSLTINTIYLPRIGCGLGGLDWDTEVLPVIEEVTSIFTDVQFIVCDI